MMLTKKSMLTDLQFVELTLIMSRMLGDKNVYCNNVGMSKNNTTAKIQNYDHRPAPVQ